MSRFKEWKRPEFDEQNRTKFNWVCQHHENLFLGVGCDIGAFSYLNAKNGISIGENVEIGSHCSVYSISTIDNKEGRVVIGKNARIGTHSVIMPNVHIGENAVIGAFSFVNKDVAPDTLSFGIPIRRILKPGEKTDRELRAETAQTVRRLTDKINALVEPGWSKESIGAMIRAQKEVERGV